MALPSHYSTGTATVTNGSATITGTNTFWIDKVRPGDLFGNDDGFLVRIATVVSDTELTLAFAWPGTSVSDAAYEVQITPDAARVQEQTRRLLEELSAGGGPLTIDTYDPNGIGLDVFDAANTNVQAAWAGVPAIVRKVGAKLNADLPSSGDLGHDPSATASFNHGALQDAVDAIQAEANGGLLNIGRGTFTHSATINLPKVSGKRCILRGHGEATQLYFPASAAMNALYAGGASAGGGLGWTLQDFKIVSDTDDFVTGIYLENANSARIERVAFEALKECIVSDTSFGLRIIANRALSIGGDFFRAVNRTHGNIFDQNGYYTSTGYLANFEDVNSNINNAFTNNDSEVVGGVIKSSGAQYGLAYNHNYMEGATSKIFDFAAPVYGDISDGNTFQMSVACEIDYFLGRYVGNHQFNQVITWGPNSFPTAVSGNIVTGTSSLQEKPKRVLTLNAAYTTQANYEVPSCHMDASGLVHLQGNVTPSGAAPTLPQTLATLPAGFRPALNQTFLTVGTTAGYARIRVAITGDVIVETSTTSQVSLNGISFIAKIS